MLICIQGLFTANTKKPQNQFLGVSFAKCITLDYVFIQFSLICVC